MHARLRLEHQFRGYIHLKTIPEASPALIAEAGRYADRISINIELPTRDDVERLAPQKRFENTELVMKGIRDRIAEAKNERKQNAKAPALAPAGQSTQMIVGATAAGHCAIVTFPVDLNRSPRELLLRVPGLGTKSVERILRLRRWHKLRLEDLPRLHVRVQKVLPFVITADHNARALTIDRENLTAQLRPASSQLDLFPVESSVMTGQL